MGNLVVVNVENALRFILLVHILCSPLSVLYASFHDGGVNRIQFASVKYHSFSTLISIPSTLGNGTFYVELFKSRAAP